MRFEGTLDAFSLPDIFQLLSFTKKTGTLHLRRDAAHGAIHLREGAVTGARADVGRQELGRRMLGAGLVDDESLALAAQDLASDASLSLAQLLADRGDLAAEAVRGLAEEQAYDAVFSLLRWPDGEFSFVIDETDPDDLGALLSVESVITEGGRRIAAWAELVESVPAPDAVVRVNPAPSAEPVTDRDEWALLSLVDGRRTVTDLVTLSGRGEYAVVCALAGLVSRGLLLVGAVGQDQFARRQSLLAALEGQGVAQTAPVASAPAPAPSLSVQAPALVLPVAPEPFSPLRRPDHAQIPAYARNPVGLPTTAGQHGSVHGATARQPELSVEASLFVERDPSVNRSLLLRLIAGVKGL
ncbi:MAG: DUF4388 domain-containing protein [Frankiales bacterium]|nr:DUF4388 domain-containing protein [Frankiales bacterium]